MVRLLTQGITPERLAATLAIGTACSLFPILGVTALLNLAVGLRFRMNQPILQTLNQVLGPLHLLLILPYVRLGEWLWRANEDRFTVAELISDFRHDNLVTFLQRFGWAGVHAVSAWIVTAPLLVFVLYLCLRPVIRNLDSIRVRGSRAFQ